MMRHPAVRPALAWLAGLLVLGTASQAPAADLPADLELVPRDAAGFFHFRAADIYKTDWLADFRHLADKAGPAALKTFQQKFVPDPASIDRVTLVMLTPTAFGQWFPEGNPEAVSALVVFRTTKPYDRLRVRESLGLREKLYKRHLYYFNEELWSGLVFIDDQTFLIGSEDAILQYLDRPRDAKKDGALQPALQIAAGKHQLTVGLNTQVLGKEGGGGPPSLTKLLEARCATMTFDLDKDLHYVTRFDFAKDEEAKEGAKALREFLDMGREQMKFALQRGEDALKEKRENQDLASSFGEGIGTLFGLGILREVDRVMKEAPIAAQGTTVTLDISYKGMPSMNAALVGMVGTNLYFVRSFRNFGRSFGRVSDRDPHEAHLKQIAEALDKYHEEKGSYPPPAILDKDGRPLLSWRVALLPYMGDEEKALYSEFNPTEPWDSLHNKKLLKKLPGSFRSPDSYREYKTTTLLFSGEGAVFGPKGVKKSDLKPGAALLADGNEDSAVYWSKPADFTIVDGKPLPEFWGSEGNHQLHVLFADGSFRHFAKGKVEDKILRDMAKPSGATKLPPPDKKPESKDESKE